MLSILLMMRKTRSAFTLIEVIIVVVLFGIIAGVLFSVYTTVSKSQQEIGATTALTQETNDLFEFINYASTKYTIDYEEYWNRSRVGCDASDGKNFSWNVNTFEKNGHCDQFTAYGNYNSAYSSSVNQPLLYTCSSNFSDNSNYPKVIKESTLKTKKNGCFSSHTKGKQAYGQYKWQFWDMMTGGVNQGNEQFLGKGPIAIDDLEHVKELYLISRDGTQRLFLRRNCTSSMYNTSKTQCGVQILRLRAFDAGVKHNVADTGSENWGKYDGTIDTRACDTAQGSSCGGSLVDTIDGMEFKMPRDNNDGWVSLTSNDVNVGDWNITISTPKDPKYSAQDSKYQVIPYAKVSLSNSLNLKKWGGLTDTGRFSLVTDTMFGFNSDVYSTEISSYKGDCGKQFLLCPTNVSSSPEKEEVTEEQLAGKGFKKTITWNPGVYDEIFLLQTGNNIQDATSNEVLGKSSTSIDIKITKPGSYNYYFKIKNKKLWDFCPDTPTVKYCGKNGTINDLTDTDELVHFTVVEKRYTNCPEDYPAGATKLNTKTKQTCKELNSSGGCAKWSSISPIEWVENGKWGWIQDPKPENLKQGEDTYYWKKSDGDIRKSGCFFTCPAGKRYDDEKKSCVTIVDCSKIGVNTYSVLRTKNKNKISLKWSPLPDDIFTAFPPYDVKIDDTIEPSKDNEIYSFISVDSGANWVELKEGQWEYSTGIDTSTKIQPILKFTFDSKGENNAKIINTCFMYKDKCVGTEGGTPNPHIGNDDGDDGGNDGGDNGGNDDGDDGGNDDGDNKKYACTGYYATGLSEGKISGLHYTDTLPFKTRTFKKTKSRGDLKSCEWGCKEGYERDGSNNWCIVGAKNCIFNGETIAHGSKVIAYETNSVAFGGTCKSEERECDNGKLSGTYINRICTVVGAKNCIFNGETIAHGGKITAYKTNSVAFGGTCKSEERECDNGKLSGTYTNTTCKILPQPQCTCDGLSCGNECFRTAYGGTLWRPTYSWTCKKNGYQDSPVCSADCPTGQVWNGNKCVVSVTLCKPTHYECNTSNPISKKTIPNGWSWSCKNGLRTNSCHECKTGYIWKNNSCVKNFTGKWSCEIKEKTQCDGNYTKPSYQVCKHLLVHKSTPATDVRYVHSCKFVNSVDTSKLIKISKENIGYYMNKAAYYLALYKTIRDDYSINNNIPTYPIVYRGPVDISLAPVSIPLHYSFSSQLDTRCTSTNPNISLLYSMCNALSQVDGGRDHGNPVPKIMTTIRTIPGGGLNYCQGNTKNMCESPNSEFPNACSFKKYAEGIPFCKQGVCSDSDKPKCIIEEEGSCKTKVSDKEVWACKSKIPGNNNTCSVSSISASQAVNLARFWCPRYSKKMGNFCKNNFAMCKQMPSACLSRIASLQKIRVDKMVCQMKPSFCEWKKFTINNGASCTSVDYLHNKVKCLSSPMCDWIHTSFKVKQVNP